MQAAGHPHWHLAVLFLALFCGWVSLFLIVRLWTVHRRDSLLKRVLWTVILCVPFFGWLFYGGCYTPPPENDIRVSANSNIGAGGLS